MGQIENIVSFSERGSLTENNGTLTNVKSPHGHGEIQLFQKFQEIAVGGPRRKTEKFWQIEKIIGDLYELDNFKQKIFFEKKISKLR